MKKAEELTLEGQIVLMVNCWSKKATLHEPQNPMDEQTKTMLDAIHKEKIRMSDYVLVMNVNGYWGKSTQSEIDYANKIGIPVKYVEPLIVTEHKSPENAGIKPSACISTEATEFLPCNSSRSESVKAGRHRDNSCVDKDGGSK
jgi:hypothetical protein